MNIKPIKTETDYKDALKRLEIVFDAPIDTLEGDEADILGLLIDEYEKKHYPIEAPDPIEANELPRPKGTRYQNNFICEV